MKLLNLVKNKLQDTKGAMDKILVTLLLVVVGVAAVVGLSTWMDTQSTAATGAAEASVNTVVTGG